MKIGALWLKESKDGKKFFSGVIEYPGMKLNIVIFRNEDKKGDNHPDYNIVWSQPRGGAEKVEEVFSNPFDDSEIPI